MFCLNCLASICACLSENILTMPGFHLFSSMSRQFLFFYLCRDFYCMCVVSLGFGIVFFSSPVSIDFILYIVELTKNIKSIFLKPKTRSRSEYMYIVNLLNKLTTVLMDLDFVFCRLG